MKVTLKTTDARKLMTQGIEALSNASANGMHIDLKYCIKQDKILNIKIKKLIKKFSETRTGRFWKKIYPKPDYNSNQQLSNILFNKLKLKSVKNTEPSKTFLNGQPSVDNESLTILKKQLPDLKPFLEYKKLDKVLNTYIANILKEQVDGKIHPFFHLHLARTYRSSSSNLNFQNQPNRDELQKKLIRSAFIPTPGNKLGTFDFSGIEVGISCCNHKDPKMIKYVIDKSTDMHRDMAIDCYKLSVYKDGTNDEKLRKGAKNGFVFPQFYGDYYGNNAPVLCDWGKLPTVGSFSNSDGLELSTKETLGTHLINKGITDYDSFVDHIRRVEEHFWKKRFKVYNQWKLNNIEEYYKKGYLNTLTGFTCSGIMSKNQINNYPIQGPAFHCTLKTFIETQFRLRKYKFKSKLIGQIHDELVFDIYPKEEKDLIEMVREIACIWLRKQWKWIIVPLEIEAKMYEIDGNWAGSSTKIKLAA